MSELANKSYYVNSIGNQFVKQSGLSQAHFEKEVSFAIQHITKNPYLMKCEASSVLKSVLNLAQTGLTLNPVSKYAYLVPRYNSSTRQTECVLDPSYMGLVKLLTDTGSVKSIECNIIYEGDDIEINMMSEEKISKHTPYLFTGKAKGKIIGVYSVALLSSGDRHIELMSFADIEEIRERSESYKAYKNGKIKSCVWTTDESEMVRKTCIKRHYKYLPKTDQFEKLQHAIDLDHIASGHAEPVSYTTSGLIESKLQTSGFDADQREEILIELSSCEYEHEAKKILRHVNENQLSYGDQIIAQNQTEINKALDNRLERES